jgi:hypothetical protein
VYKFYIFTILWEHKRQNWCLRTLSLQSWICSYSEEQINLSWCANICWYVLGKNDLIELLTKYCLKRNWINNSKTTCELIRFLRFRVSNFCKINLSILSIVIFNFLSLFLWVTIMLLLRYNQVIGQRIDLYFCWCVLCFNYFLSKYFLEFFYLNYSELFTFDSNNTFKALCWREGACLF